MRFILAPTSSYPSENVFHNVCFLPFRVYSTDNQLIIDTFADTKISKNVQLYYQKVVNLPFFVTIKAQIKAFIMIYKQKVVDLPLFVTSPFPRSRKMTQMTKIGNQLVFFNEHAHNSYNE